MNARDRAELAAGIIRAIGAFLMENADAVAAAAAGSLPGPAAGARSEAPPPYVPDKGAKVRVAWKAPYSPDEVSHDGSVAAAEVRDDGVYLVALDAGGEVIHLEFYADKVLWRCPAQPDAYGIRVSPLE